MEIKVKFSSAALWGNVEPVEDGWNEGKSEDAFALALVNHINDEYPQANVEVVHGIDDSVCIDGFYDDEEIPYIEDVISKVWNGDDWMIAA